MAHALAVCCGAAALPPRPRVLRALFWSGCYSVWRAAHGAGMLLVP